MRLARRSDRRTVAATGEPVVIFSVSGQTFAIAAFAVEEIRTLEGIEEFHGALAHPRLQRVRYTILRNGSRYFVVDANLHYYLMPSIATRLLILRDSDVAVLVDGIERMGEIAQIHPLPQAFFGEEREWYRGLAQVGDLVVPVVNPSSFLSRAELALAYSAFGAAKAVTA